VVTTGSIFAQEDMGAENDSLQNLLPSLKDDTNKVKALHMLSNNYSVMDIDTGLHYGQQCLDLATMLNWDRGIAMAYDALGINFQFKADHDKALEYYCKALKIEETAGFKSDLAGTLGLIGMVYQSQSSYPAALEVFLRKLKISEELANKHMIAVTTSSLARVYDNMDDTAKAHPLYFKALKMEQDLGGVQSALIGEVAGIYEERLDYTTALAYYLKALKMNQKKGNKQGVARASSSVGRLYAMQKNYPLAIEYLQKAFEMMQELGDRKGLVGNFMSFGRCYLGMAEDAAADNRKMPGKATQARKAISFLERGLALSLQIRASKEATGCYHMLEEAYKLTGDYKRAADCADNYIIMKDSVYSKERGEKMITMQMTYDFEKKELAEKDAQEKKDILAKAEIIKQKNQKRWLICGAILLLLVAGGSVYFLYYTRKSKRAIEVLMKEIHHRVKNNLQVISTLLQLQLKNVTDESAVVSLEEGISRISSIALIHQHLYKADQLTAIEFSAFAKELLHQVSSVYLKPGQEINLQNDIPETWFDIDTALPLGLVLNELMTNSYKYAWHNTREVKTTLNISLKGNEYTLEYCDNGPGLALDYEVETVGSLGMTIIKSLSQQLGGSFMYRKSDNCFVVRFLNARARKNIA